MVFFINCHTCPGDTLWRLIVGVSCLLCSSALPGVWSFLRVTPFGSHDTLPLHHDAHELTRQHDLTDLTCQHEEDSKVMLCAVVTKE